MDDMKLPLFSGYEMEKIRTFRLNVLSEKKRLLRRHRGFINKNTEDIDAFFKYPRVIQIETIANCNATCIMCPTPKIRRTRRVMKDNVFE